MRRPRQLAFETLEGKALLSPLPAPVVKNSPPVVAPQSQGLVMRLTTDHRVYHPGQPIVVTLIETNTSPHVVSLVDGPSTSAFVAVHNGRRIWTSNSGIQPMFLVSKSLQPGQSITLSAMWDGHSNIGPTGAISGRVVIGSQSTGAPHVNILIERS
jgi:hypothetical protein